MIPGERRAEGLHVKIIYGIRWLCQCCNPREFALLGTFGVGKNPRDVAFDGANIWVTNWNSGTVSKL